jgi:type IV pilus assembly protein PilC
MSVFERTAEKISSGTATAESREEKSTLDKLNSISVEFGPSRKDILNFTNQLAVMVRAGISLQDALEGIAEQVKNNKFKAILTDLKNRIESGQSFSQALGEHPEVFSNLYINMVAAAELSGSLSMMLEQLVDYLDQEAETRSQVITAMVYPAIIAITAVVTIVFLLTFVLPRFLAIFEGKEHLLPAPTKIIMALSGTMRNYWYIVFPSMIGAVGAVWLFIQTKVGKVWWDTAKLHIPLVKTMCRCLYITRSLHTMGVLTNAGVPILDTLSITSTITGNVHYERMWKGVQEEVRQGKKIAPSLDQYDLLPGSVIQMISSGEESGTLAEVLSNVAIFYGRELKTVIKAVTSMIEPLMIVIMGALVGFIASSIILPIFKMSSMAGH